MRALAQRKVMPLARWSLQLCGYRYNRVSYSFTNAWKSWDRPRDFTTHYWQKRRFTSSALPHSPTIYAHSTGSGPAAIAVVRCSGSLCLEIYQALCPGAPTLKPRRASLRTLSSPYHDGSGVNIIDSHAVVLYFPSPHSATGEDVLELHVHGGPALVKALLRAIPRTVPQTNPSQPYIRYAEPGEFTRRAFYNNRLDLTQVQRLGDILSAETEQQRRLAPSGMSNTLNERYEKWRIQLLDARGELEALIDFSEDQHFDESAEDFVESITGQIRTLITQIQKTTANAVKGELLRNGVQIALLGAPNAGKSSLFNRIVQHEAAIVSAEAGTTRDVIQVNVDIGGFFCKFKDLAGIRSSGNGTSSIGDIEQEGIIRAKAEAKQADVVIVLLPFVRDTESNTVTVDFDADILNFIRRELLGKKRIIFALSKSDLAGESLEHLVESANSFLWDTLETRYDTIPISCTDSASTEDSSEGVKGLLDHLTTELTDMTAAEEIGEGSGLDRFTDPTLGTTHRQETLLAQCAINLEAFLKETDQSSRSQEGGTNEIDVVLAAERLRVAADCLAKITNRGHSGDVEELLGVVFEKFCVGK